MSSGSLPSFSSLLTGARFLNSVRGYLRRPVSISEARIALADRLARRADRLLDRLKHDVFGQPGGVYSGLFRSAGCTYGDAESSVRKDGVEATLERFFRAGVYLSVDEFKGRKNVVRGSFEIPAGPERLRSPRASFHLPVTSGGSRSAGTPVLFDFGFVRDCASNSALCIEAWGGRAWRKGDWETPGAGARFRLLKYAAFGDPPDAWFSQIDIRDPSIPAFLRWNTTALCWASRVAGRPIPPPVYAPLTDPTPAAEWMASVLRSGRIPFLFTFPGSAVRLCLTAKQKGISIAGARFMLSGEPITAARIATIRSAGCTPIPRYGSIETGAIGYGCANGEHADDVHMVGDMQALIQAGASNPAGLPSNAILISTLHPLSPFLMLNVSMGDAATLRERQCGCAVQQLGWTRLLHDIRSFEKLTGNGVTFLGTEVIRILEDVLPLRFGGAPTDYQLMEEETTDGLPILSLSAHPSLGPIDEDEIAECFLAELATTSAAARIMTQMWRDSNTFRVARRPPVVSKAGKILHLQLASKAV